LRDKFQDGTSLPDPEGGKADPTWSLRYPFLNVVEAIGDEFGMLTGL
jgi:hypothetical protein